MTHKAGAFRATLRHGNSKDWGIKVKKSVIVMVLLITIFLGYATDRIPATGILQFSPVVQPFGENPEKKDIYKNFNIVLIYSDKKISSEIILTCKNGTIYDKSGNMIFSLNKRGPAFYGYRLDLLPWNKNSDHPGDLILGPVFGDGRSVGDTLTFVWNKEKKTYYRFVPDIP